LAVQSVPTDAGRPDARRIGTAVHRIFERIDLSSIPDRSRIETAIESLVKEGQIAPSLVPSIDPAAIEAFFNTEAGRLAVAGSSSVLREWPFTMAIPASEISISTSEGDRRFSLSRNTGDDFVIVQGIVDMIVPDGEGLAVIDFKTDHIRVSEAPVRAELYRGQMALYCRAAKAILRKPIHRVWLYFAAPGTLVALDIHDRAEG
jgi:ATP-dependent helicase/nuclease subunit A